MTIREMAKILNCSVRHARRLVYSGRIGGTVVTNGAKSSYTVSIQEIRKYEKTKSAVGFPRGARRDGPRGKMVYE